MGATDTEKDMAEQLREAAATVTVTTRLLRWGGVAFAAFAGAWAVRTDTRLNSMETTMAELAGDRGRIVVEYDKWQRRIEDHLTRLAAATEQQGKLLARMEAQIENLRKQ